MLNNYYKIILLYGIFILHINQCLSVTCTGCVDLDEISFNKTIRRFPYTFVKFDIAFPYGEKHEAFAALSQTVHRITDDLLIATVGIKDYGQMENQELGLRYGYNEKNLPGFELFIDGNINKRITLPSYLDVTETNLKEFINKNTKLYIGCDGCLKEFNILIKNFVNLNDLQQEDVIEKLLNLQQQLQNESHLWSAKVYINIANKLKTDGYDFVENETKRLLRLRADKISAVKKLEVERKLNILNMFRVNKLKKDEL